MKHKALQTRSLTSCVSVLALGAVLISATALRCEAASGDPSGGNMNTWDCIFGNGIQTGISFLTFSSNFTFSGYEVIAPKGSVFSTINSNQLTTGRGGNTGLGRVGSVGSSGKTNEFLFGFQFITGNWTTNIQGNIIGSFERVVGTETEAVSFVGKATYAKTSRLMLVASTPEGNMSYRGVLTPPATTPELAGNWYGYASSQNETELELFTLSDTGLPGLFDVTGNGPNYSISGECVISSQKRIGFADLLSPDTSTTNLLRATVGTYSNTTNAITAKTLGAQDPDGTKVTFKAVLPK